MDNNRISKKTRLRRKASKKYACHQEPLDLLKKIKKTTKKENERALLRELCSTVSTLLRHCISLMRGSPPRSANRTTIRRRPPDREEALANAK
jgi:hypothetical protein